MPGMPLECASLYRRALGADFDRLPPVLQAFHDLHAAAKGAFKITRGAGPVRALVANAMRLPPAGDGVPVRLRVEEAAGRERWTRDFGTYRLVTEQWMQGSLLVEAAGPIRFGFRLSAADGQMRFRMERCWLGALPVPMFAAPRVTACVTGLQSTWQVWVQVDVPPLGMIVRYEGELAPATDEENGCPDGPSQPDVEKATSL
ncbi:MAG TPA: DUF4166 domain-containing protein [Chthonomonadaceae bacterium]|nr:DUF4166 domain-containing protein [Chthonomonadaceae bacterium]